MRIDVAEVCRKHRALERERAAAMNRYLAELEYDAWWGLVKSRFTSRKTID